MLAWFQMDYPASPICCWSRAWRCGKCWETQPELPTRVSTSHICFSYSWRIRSGILPLGCLRQALPKRWRLMGSGLDAQPSWDAPRASPAISRPRMSTIKRAATLLRSIGDRWALSIVLSHLGLIAYKQKDYQTARAWFEYRIAVGRELAFQRSCGPATVWLGFAALAEDDLASAAALFKEALTLSSTIRPRQPFCSRLFRVWRWSHNGEGHLKQAVHLWAARQTILHARQTMWPSDSKIDDEADISDFRARLR